MLRRVSRDELFSGRSWPWWWGCAYRDYVCDEFVLAPIPLNRILGLLRRIWIWVSVQHRQQLEHDVHAASYQQGWEDGCRSWLTGKPQRLTIVRPR